MKLLIALALFFIFPVLAGAQTEVPHRFADGQIIEADDFNDNFDALEAAIEAIPAGFEMPVGTILMYAGSVAPAGFLMADGASVSRAEYPELFEVIGTSFGQDPGLTRFNLPDLRQRFPMGAAGQVGATGGVSSVELTADTMPSHSHTLSDPGHSHTFNIGAVDDMNFTAQAGQLPAADSTMIANQSSTAARTTGIVVNATGDGQAFSVLNPYIALNYIIKY